MGLFLLLFSLGVAGGVLHGRTSGYNGEIFIAAGRFRVLKIFGWIIVLCYLFVSACRGS